MVLLPEPDNPVNQSVAPVCFSNFFRSAAVTVPSCQVICVALTGRRSSRKFQFPVSGFRTRCHVVSEFGFRCSVFSLGYADGFWRSSVS